MGYYVKKAGPLSREGLECSDEDWERICKFALPPGFSYLVSSTNEIVEPVLLFLYGRYRGRRKRLSIRNTVKSFCDDLYELFSYYEVVGLRWDTIDLDDIIQYREMLETSFSPLTGEEYKRSTIRRRMSTIERFYRWAVANRLCAPLAEQDDGDPATASSRRGSRGGTPNGNAPDALGLVPEHDGADSVDAIGADDLRQVLKRLGPLPANRGASETSVYRLAASVAVGTGMRLDEVVQLTMIDIINIRPKPSQTAVSLVITKTKGGRPRRVFIPNDIYDDLMLYISGERAECVRDSGLNGPLFVNRSDARRNSGGALTGHTLSCNFRKAVMDADLSYLKPIVREGRIQMKVKARHSFHDLRHTYAVVMYQQLVKRGKSAPWLVLSRLLGHKYVDTTVRIYLRSVEGIEAEVTDLVNKYLRYLRDA